MRPLAGSHWAKLGWKHHKCFLRHLLVLESSVLELLRDLQHVWHTCSQVPPLSRSVLHPRVSSLQRLGATDTRTLGCCRLQLVSTAFGARWQILSQCCSLRPFRCVEYCPAYQQVTCTCILGAHDPCHTCLHALICGLQSAVDTTFWEKLKELKLDQLGLSESPLPLGGVSARVYHDACTRVLVTL